jgi:hypothetical protein
VGPVAQRLEQRTHNALVGTGPLGPCICTAAESAVFQHGFFFGQSKIRNIISCNFQRIFSAWFRGARTDVSLINIVKLAEGLNIRASKLFDTIR